MLAKAVQVEERYLKEAETGNSPDLCAVVAWECVLPVVVAEEAPLLEEEAPFELGFRKQYADRLLVETL